MAVSSPTSFAAQLNRCSGPRSPPPPPPPLGFHSRTAFFSDSPSAAAAAPRLVSARSQPLGPDSFRSRPSTSLDDSDASIGSSASSLSLSTSSAVDFLTLCNRLKTTKRKGWVNHGIKSAESIADHMYRMALMSLIGGDLPGVNKERCIKIAIVHDIAEAIVGDITPSDGVPKQEKSRMERAALNEMCNVLGGGMEALEIKELWEEYENNSSIEAKLVKDFDKVEMILQALEYENEHGKVLDEFFLSTAGKFQTEIGKNWAAEINRRRKHRLPKNPN